MAAESRSKRESGQTSSLTAVLRWVQLKKYQYEVTYSLYMLTPAEKIVFNSILFLLISLFCTAAYFYLPGHIMIIYNRVWYYIHGDFALEHARRSLPHVGSISSTLRAAKDAALSSDTFAKAAQAAQTFRQEL